MQKFIVVLLAALFLTSCGQLNTDSSNAGGGGEGGLLGADRGVIKNAGTTVAKIVAWLDTGGKVAVYIPSADRYASIDLETGAYVSRGIDSDFSLYYSTDGCSGTPVVSSQHFVGEVGKAVLYHPATDTYFRVVSSRSSYAYKSKLGISAGCDDVDATFSADTGSGPFDIEVTTRPYNFEAIAPLTITYE